MSTPKSPDAKFLEQIEGLTPDVLRIARAEWRKHPIMRQVISILAEDKIEERRTALESCDPTEMKKIQGEISAIREFLAVINDQATK